MKYKEYLESKHWQKVRGRKIAAVGGWCEACSLNRASQVHHKHYRSVGREELWDLEAVCPLCHMERHPGKFTLAPLYDDYDCPVCPGDTAQVFIGDRSILRICTECGYDSSVPRKARKHRRRRQRQPCRICKKPVIGMRQHMKAKHSKPTLEELEAPRREAERDKVLAMP